MNIWENQFLNFEPISAFSTKFEGFVEAERLVHRTRNTAYLLICDGGLYFEVLGKINSDVVVRHGLLVAL